MIKLTDFIATARVFLPKRFTSEHWRKHATLWNVMHLEYFNGTAAMISALNVFKDN